MAKRDKKEAARLARLGRRGDQYLLHITGPELQALAQTGKLTYNPKTGLPEAGFFSSLIGFAAPILGGIFGGPPGAALGGAIGSAAQGGDFGDIARGAVTSGLGAGIGGELFGGGDLNIGFDDAWSGAADLGGAGFDFEVDAPDFGRATTDVVGSQLFTPTGVGDLSGFQDFEGAGQGGFASGDAFSFGASPSSSSFLSRLASGAAANPWGTLSRGMDVGSGLYGLMQSRRLQRMAQMLAQQADPFAQYRPGFGAQLQQLSQDPSRITQTPGWDAGIQAVRRSAAGQGYTNSGNEISALMNFGGNFYNREAERLAGLAGAGFNPANSGALMLQGTEGGLNLAGQSLNRLSRGIGGFGMRV